MFRLPLTVGSRESLGCVLCRKLIILVEVLQNLVFLSPPVDQPSTERLVVVQGYIRDFEAPPEKID